ncbi:glycosyltransferase family 4 protein [Vibrio sp. 10N.286.51.F4]|uniref:glycosyltransferase family 4 protein n=1 Tax=Vibrio sp. 10N.286.51.F4 TaxID=3229710 RepID=UPI00354E43C6
MKEIIIIGTLTDKFGGRTGGIAVHVEQLASELSRKGFIVTVYSDTCITTRSCNGFDVIGVKNKLSTIKTFLVNPVKSIVRLIKRDLIGIKKLTLKRILSQSHKPAETVIHVHSLHNSLIDDEIMFEFDCIFTDHGFWQAKDYNNELIQHRIEKSKGIISVSKYAQKILLSEFSIPETSKLYVVHNPVLMRSIVMGNDKSREHVFFNGLSESIERKGFLDFLYLTESNFGDKFVAIVDNRAKSYCEKLSINNLEIKGKCNLDEVNGIYDKSKAMVLPSRSESFGLVYIEAALSGVPVIGYKPVIDEFNNILNIDIGLPFDPENEDKHDLLDKYRELMSTKYDHEEIYEAIKCHLGWFNQIDKFILIYKSKNESI